MIPYTHRAWNADDFYRRDAQDEPTAEELGADEDFIPCECGSGFERGDCLPCWFDHHVVQIEPRP